MEEIKVGCCVVGGGPAGMMLGFLLARAGVDVFVLDRADAEQATGVEKLGMRAVVTGTIMTGVAKKKALARVILAALGI